MKQIYTLLCSITLFNLDSWIFNTINKSIKELFHNCSRPFKDAGKYSRTTKCFQGSRTWPVL